MDDFICSLFKSNGYDFGSVSFTPSGSKTVSTIHTDTAGNASLALTKTVVISSVTSTQFNITHNNGDASAHAFNWEVEG